MDGLALVALGLCGSLGYIGAFLVLGQQPYFTQNSYHLPLLATTLYLLPLTHGAITRSAPNGWRRGVLEFVVITMQVSLLAALVLLGMIEFAMGAAALMMGHLLCGWRSAPQSIGIVVVTLMLAHIARGIVPGKLTVCLLLLSFPATVLALGCIHSRHVRRLGLRVRPEHLHPYESRRSIATRILGAMVVALLCLLVALITHHLTNVPPRTSNDRSGEGVPPDADQREERPRGDEPVPREPGSPEREGDDGEREDSGDPSSTPSDPGGAGDDPEEPPDEEDPWGEDLEDPLEQPDSEDAPLDDDSLEQPPPDLLDLVQSIIDPSQPGIRYVTVPDYARGHYTARIEDVQDHPWKLILAILSQLLIIGWILRRRLRSALNRHGIRVPGQRRSDFYFDKLLYVLEGYGHRIHEAQTPREFTRSVVRARGHLFEPCNEVTALLYRSRYGEQDLTVDERRHIERVISRLENRDLSAIPVLHSNLI